MHPWMSFPVVLAAVVLLGGAQAGLLGDTVGSVGDTVDSATGTVGDVVDGANDAVGDTVDQTTGAADDVTGTVEDTTGVDLPVSGDTVDDALDPVLGDGGDGSAGSDPSDDGTVTVPIEAQEGEQFPGDQNGDGSSDSGSGRDAGAAGKGFPVWGILAIMGGVAILGGGTAGYFLGRRR